MNIIKQPYEKRLVLEFKDKAEYQAFMEILRIGKETLETGIIAFDEDFQPIIMEFASSLEGTLIYPKNYDY